MIEKIASDLSHLGINKGDEILVHTAFSKLGKGVDPDDVIAGLRLAIGDEGTLVIPSLSWENVNKENPVFDVYDTPACIGFFPEYFRKTEGVRRSVHPTHSCSAIGKNADAYISLHQLDRTPVGENSPFRILSNRKGKILFLGVVSTPNTSMHGVEELVGPDYLYGDDLEYTLNGYDGFSYKAVYHTHGFKNTAQRYERAETLMNQYELSKGYVLEAYCTLMSSEALWKKGKEALEKDNHFFVDIRK